MQVKIDFENGGSTRKEVVTVETLSDLAEEWFNNYKNWVTSENTLNRVRGYLDTYIIPRFGDYLPAKIEPAEIQRWVNELAEKSKKSVESGIRRSEKGSAKDFGAVIHKLSDIFNFGITNYGLKRNPASTITIPLKPKATKKKIMVLHDEELSIWLNFLSELPNTRANRRFKIICNTLLASALRINELLALDIHDLNIETSEIIVNKTLVWKKANRKLGTKGEIICKPTPKTDAGNRQVAVPKNVIEDLINFHLEMNDYFRKHGLPESDHIFPTIYGNYMCDRNERTTSFKLRMGDFSAEHATFKGEDNSITSTAGDVDITLADKDLKINPSYFLGDADIASDLNTSSQNTLTIDNKAGDITIQ